jgi:Na+/melibiose symporter-like transporter
MKLDEARRVPRGVWILGFVSLLMDVSSEMIHCLLPVFMVSALGAGALAVGLVEGVAEATALIVKVFSGTLSDFIGRRKELAVFGYGLGAVSKPLFALAASVPAVLGARFIDRVGKGMRGAPRDALVADMTPPALRGEAYGLRQALDSVGAFLGPLLALALMAAWKGDFRRVFWVAALPGGLAVSLLAFGVQEPRSAEGGHAKAPVSWRSLERLDAAYWRLVLLGAVFTLARRIRNASLKRASESKAPKATTSQKRVPSLRIAALSMGSRASRASLIRGSRTDTANRATARKPGTAAIQKTAR